MQVSGAVEDEMFVTHLFFGKQEYRPGKTLMLVVL